MAATSAAFLALGLVTVLPSAVTPPSFKSDTRSESALWLSIDHFSGWVSAAKNVTPNGSTLETNGPLSVSPPLTDIVGPEPPLSPGVEDLQDWTSSEFESPEN